MALANGQYSQWQPMHDSSVHEVNELPETFSYKPHPVIETLEVEDTPSYRKQTFQQKYFGGLKRTLRAFVAVAAVVLAINIGWLGFAKSKYGIRDGYGIISEGGCDSVKQTNTWLHLLINVLSTLLLTGSNAFMATYSGPTRKEIDAAHAQRRWLHVGSMSFRNMRGIAKRKTLIVLILAISSVPFHLLYNSMVFMETATNNYYWIVATEDFSSGATYNLTGPLQNTDSRFSSSGPYFDFDANLPDDSSIPRNSLNMTAVKIMYDFFDDVQKSASSWEKLDTKACIQAYSNVFVASRRNVVLVSSEKNESNSVLMYGAADVATQANMYNGFFSSDLDSNWWICSKGGRDGEADTCNPQSYASNANSWEVYGHPIDHCLSQQVGDTCSVKFSMEIMYAMIAFNALKLVAMAWILLRLDAEHILASVGDAAASFIKNPDPTTQGMCLASRREIEHFWRAPGFGKLWNGTQRHHWGQAVSKKRWIIFFLLMAFAFCTVFFFGVWGFTHVKNLGVSLGPSGLWSLGFGAANQNTMVLSDVGKYNTVAMAVLANTPQVILALIWLVYMGIVTSMFVTADWAKFASTAQTLMVSSPVAAQRGTWLLGAPLAYGIGLMVLQTLLHWFVSQSIFLVQIVIYNKLGQRDVGVPVYSNCGYSPVAIIFAVVTSILLLASAVVFMFRKLPAGSPPVVSTCSAAISAACHVPPALNSDALVYGKLRWGVTASLPNGLGHCSLAPEDSWTSGYTRAPFNGVGYAGLAGN